MKPYSPSRDYQEGRRRNEHEPSSRSRTDPPARCESSIPSSSSASCSTFSSHCRRGVFTAPNPSPERSSSDSAPRGRSTKKRRKAESQEKSKRKSSEKSKKKKHHKKRKRRVSTSTSLSSRSSRSRSRSTSRSRSRPSISETRWSTPHPRTAASIGSDESVFAPQAGVVNSRIKATGWDVGPDGLDGRRLGDDGGSPQDQSRRNNGNFSPSSKDCPAALYLEHRGAGGERQEENLQQHDSKTYEKAFGVAIPSGQYGFVTEDTDLTLLQPGAASIPAEKKHVRIATVGAVRPPPTNQTSTGVPEVGDSAGDSGGRLRAGPPALGVLRLLKEANDAEKAKHAQKSDNSADGLKKGTARGGPGENKVTSKTHAHLFWQCWNCNADNYKTRHQCYRCNRLYMQ